jgi:hypothetical protein
VTPEQDKEIDKILKEATEYYKKKGFIWFFYIKVWDKK